MKNELMVFAACGFCMIIGLLLGLYVVGAN